jgi:peptide/nickel transport system substrate-binding protein
MANPALPPDFVSLPYANPDAPKGGRIVQGEDGSFDSLNPLYRQGHARRLAARIRSTHEIPDGPLELDEPFTLYGLLAESVETDAARTWVEFTMREEARFSDGTPVTVEDVLWSYETLGTDRTPALHGGLDQDRLGRAVGPRSVRFTFNTEDREMPLGAGTAPDPEEGPMAGRERLPNRHLDRSDRLQAPYVVDRFEPGRFMSLIAAIPTTGARICHSCGVRHNLDEIRMEFYADGTGCSRRSRPGTLTSMRETNAAKWAVKFDFPAVTLGEMVKSVIPHQRPSGNGPGS